MKTNNMISVIIPNYNNSKYITRCLNSIEIQTYKNIEVIIVDDGSTDDSLNIINNYIKNSKMIINLITQYNQNASIARNKGLELCKGEFLYFLDSDDCLYDKNVFQNLIDNIYDYDLLVGEYIVIDENENEVDNYIFENDDFLSVDNIYKFSIISPLPSNKLYRSSIVKNNNIYFANVRIGQDLNFYLKYLSFCKNVKIIKNKIYKYRVVKTGMTQNVNLNILDITNNFADVKRFYEKNNNEENYQKYISTTELKHYVGQMAKLSKIKSKRMRKIIFSYFSYFIDNISHDYSDENLFFKKEHRKFIIKKYFRLIYVSNLYCNYKKNRKKAFKK